MWALVTWLAQYPFIEEDAINDVGSLSMIYGIFFNSGVVGSLGSRVRWGSEHTTWATVNIMESRAISVNIRSSIGVVLWAYSPWIHVLRA